MQMFAFRPRILGFMAVRAVQTTVVPDRDDTGGGGALYVGRRAVTAKPDLARFKSGFFEGKLKQQLARLSVCVFAGRDDKLKTAAGQRVGYVFGECLFPKSRYC